MVKMGTFFGMSLGAFVFWQTMDKVRVWIALHQDEKRLADYVGLPCRIARGCTYCVSDHRSSCLVKVYDKDRLSREYVVDLVGEPGNVHSPDLSINGAVCSSVPSPFQISHLKEFQQPDVNDEIDTQISK